MATKQLQILGSFNQDTVQFVEQDLTDEQKAQARENIGAASLDENGKVPLEQLPDNIGSDSGLTEVFWEDIQDRPFYDTRVMSLYSYAENPNPVSFDCAATGYSLYKISDLVLTKEEMFNADIVINGKNYEKYSQDNVLIETDQLLMVQYPNNGFAFCLCNTIGTCPFTYMGYSLSVDVPEVGIYRISGLGYGMSDVSTIEILVSGELKPLDLKYLPENMALGYDTRIRSYYSQVENPNPPQIDNAMMSMSCYKVSDLVPTRDEIFNSTKVIVNGTEYMFAESNIQVETDDFVSVGTSGGFGFIFVNKSGTLNFTYSGYPMSLEVPKGSEGIYYQRGLNAGVPEGRTIEFICGGELKQIDPKFIPADLDFNLDDYYTKSETYSKSEVYTKSEVYSKSEVYTKSEVYSKSEVDQIALEGKVDLSNYYTKEEVYSKSEVDDALNNIDLSNYYTKTEIDDIIGDVDTVLDEISALIGE